MINDIKAKLPLKKKAKAEELDDDQDSPQKNQDATDPGINAVDKTGATDIGAVGDISEVSDKPQTFVDRIKSKLIPKKKVAAEDIDEDGTSVGEVKKPKKKINPIVLVVVLGALGFFMFYEEEPAPVVAPAVPRKSLRTKPKGAETPAPTDATAETPKEAPADTTAETPKVTPTETPTDTTAETPKETPTDVTAETPKETPTDTTAETPKETPTDVTDDVPDVTSETPTDTTAETPKETPTDTTTAETPTETTSETPKETATTTSTDTLDGKEADTEESTMTDKILEDLEKQVKKDQPKEVKKEYVGPPDYEYRGRGLVYNCSGKHWACVDGPSYKSCEDNFSSTTYKKKNIECYPFNIYDSQKGCAMMQNRVVSSNAKTGFCK